jgi:hypothetical protein
MAIPGFGWSGAATPVRFRPSDCFIVTDNVGQPASPMRHVTSVNTLDPEEQLPMTMFRKLVLCATVVFCWIGSQSCKVGPQAVTVISVTGSNQFNSNLNDADGAIPQIMGAAWSSTTGYSDVTISAELGAAYASVPFTVSAYLTTAVGPGTTSSSEIASVDLSVSPPAFTPTSVTVFSNLALPPGTYYLTLASRGSNPIWFGDFSPVATTAEGVSLVDEYMNASAPVSGYIPAMSTSSVSGGRRFRVGGIPD